MDTKKVIDIICEKYNKKVIEFFVVPRMMFRENMIFVDADNNKYIVKKYPSNTEYKYLLQLGNLYKIMSDYSIVTNKLCVQNTDISFFDIKDGKYMVFTYVDGSKCSKESMGEDLSKSLKYLHSKLNQLDYGIAMTKTLEQVNQCKIDVENWEAIDDFSRNIIALKGKFKETLDRYSPENTSIIHGDCTRNNIIEGPNGFVFIDFDNYKIGDPLEDLANLINSVLYDGEFTDSKEKMKAIHTLVKGYGANYYDVEKVKLYMQVNCILEIQKHQENYRFLKRNPGTSNYLSKLLEIFIQVNEECLL